MNLAYWIPKERYMPLKRFCLTYRQIKFDLKNQSYYSNAGLKQLESRKSFIDPTANRAAIRISLSTKVQIIEAAAIEAAGPNYVWYLMKDVTEGYPFELLKHLGLDLKYKEYADIRCKFFWILSENEKLNSIVNRHND